jgi:hypothetical protein
MHAGHDDEVMIERNQPVIGKDGISAMGFSAAQLEEGNGMATSEFLNSGLQNNLSFLANVLSNFVPEGTVNSDAGSAMHLGRAL